MAIIKAVYDNEDDVPEAYRELFEAKDGKQTLKRDAIEGVKTQADVDRINAAAKKERTARAEAEAKLKKFEKLGDRDPEEILALADQVDDLKAQLEAGGGTGKGPTEEMIQARIAAKVKAETAKLERELDRVKGEAATHKTTAEQLTGKMKRARLEAELQKAGAAAKIRPEAMGDLLRYADVFEVGDDDKVITRDGVGFAPGMEPDVWLTDLKQSRPHWWAESSGGGARGSNGNGASSSDNPFSKSSPNFTKAGELMAKDPGKATQFAKAAGYADTNAAISAMSKALSAPPRPNNGA